MRTRFTLALVSALLTIGLIGVPVSANTIPESFSVTPTLTVTIDQTSIDYGALPPGGTPATFGPINGTVNSNAPVRVTFAGSSFSRTGGGSLGQDIRWIHVYDVGNQLEANPDTGLGGAFLEKTTSALEALPYIYQSTGPVTDGDIALNLYVRIPTDALPGAYSGSVELTFTNY